MFQNGEGDTQKMLKIKILYKLSMLTNFIYLISLLKKLDINPEVHMTLSGLVFTLMCFAFAAGFFSRKVRK